MNANSLSRIAAVLALLGAPAIALAQTAPAAKPVKSHTEAELLKSRSQNVDAHIAMLHSQLDITPAEEPQWTQFAQVMRDNAAQMDAAFSQRGAALATMTAVQDLQSYAQIARIQSDNMQKLSAAFQTLYTQFPAAQQKLADGVFRPEQAKK